MGTSDAEGYDDHANYSIDNHATSVWCVSFLCVPVKSILF